MSNVKERDDLLKQIHELMREHTRLALPFQPNLDQTHYRKTYSRLMEVKSTLVKLQQQTADLGLGDKAPKLRQKRWER